MKENLFYAGAVSLGIALALTLFDLTTVGISFGESFLSIANVHSAAFFALVGLLLMYYGLRPLWQK